MNKAIVKTALIPSTLACALLLTMRLQALPEDAEQPIELSWESTEGFLDQNRVIYYGTPEKPAVVTQGTMRISGERIEVETEDGEVASIDVTGNPARFQQQLAADEEPVRARGLKMHFDRRSEVLTIDENVEIVESSGITTTGYHFEYNLQTRRYRATQAPDGEQATTVIPPRN